jgi:ABC-2 type transport system permease protein
MISLAKNEVYKIFKQRKIYIFMFIIFVLTCLEYVGAIIVNKASRSNSSITSPFMNMNGQTMPLMMLSGISTIIVIFITILLADIVTDEYKNGTLKLSLLAPISRSKLLVSKVVGLLFGTLILLVFTMIISYLLGTVFFGWGDKFILNGFNYNTNGDLVKQTMTFSVSKGILFTIFSYIIQVLPYMAFGMIVLFLSLLFSNMGATIGTSLGVWFAFTILDQISKDVKLYTITSYFSFYSKFIDKIDFEATLIDLSVIIVYIVIFYVLSLILFRKKDILL